METKKVTTPKPAKVPKPPKGYGSWLNWILRDYYSGHIFNDEGELIEGEDIQKYARLELAALRKQARKRGGKL